MIPEQETVAIFSNIFLKCLFLYFEQGGEGQRVRETENPKQARVVSTEPDTGLELTIREITT